MFRRRQEFQDEVVASHMRSFFKSLPGYERRKPESVARSYAKYFWDNHKGTLRDQEGLVRNPFHVGLGVQIGDLHTVTKRVTLVSDTLLLSDNWSGGYYEIERYRSDLDGLDGEALGRFGPAFHKGHDEDYYGIRTPNMTTLGNWILSAEHLLRAGLTWYLPSYCKSHETTIGKTRQDAASPVDQKNIIDFFVGGRKAIDASGVSPNKSKIVRPVLEIDLPFIDGVGLRDFSRITIDEFNSYRAFRDFLRKEFLKLDDALDSVQSEREMMKIGIEIREQVRANEAEMSRIKGKRAVAASGAVVGTVGATLVAIYGPAIQPALAVLGASGGLWAIVQAATENSLRTVRNAKPWYYVWALSKAVDRRGLL
jgi:hypothetical protein